MKFITTMFALSLSCAAQNAIQQGTQVFAKTCATGYCHGVKGQSSGAPRLAARGFTLAYINNTVTRGIAGTGMPSFATVLSKADLTAVVAYVAWLNGISNPGAGLEGAAATSSAPALSSEAVRGAQLFKEAVRGFGRCSTCHEVAGVGIPVATPIAQVPGSIGALKVLKTPNVKSGTMDGESMPVLVLSDTKQGVLFYDLTSLPPVERNAEPGSVKFAEGSAWRHSSVIGAYNESELEAILAYLRAVTN